MRSMWILPDRNQSGEMLVEDDGQTKRLAEVIDLSRLPPALVLGIPEEVLRQGAPEECIYAQFARLPNSAVFCLSLVCGRDKTGRIVSLTNIQVLNEEEVPQLPPRPLASDDPQVSDRLSYLGVHFAPPPGPVARKIGAMLAAVRTFRRLKTFASERLMSSANKPDWMPQPDARSLQALSGTTTFFLIATLVILALIASIV